MTKKESATSAKHIHFLLMKPFYSKNQTVCSNKKSLLITEQIQLLRHPYRQTTCKSIAYYFNEGYIKIISKKSCKIAMSLLSLCHDKSPICGSGVIGSRTRLRIWRREAWGFESLLPHLMSSRT